MKIRRVLSVLLALALLLGLIPAMASVGTGWDDECRGNVKAGADGTTSYGKHNWVKQSETPGKSCTSKGTAVYHCSYCGASVTRATKAPGHKWGKWKTTKQATCTVQGEQTRACSVCGKTETRKTDRLPHSWGEWTVITEATDHGPGTRSHTCKVCGTQETEEFDPEGTLRRGDKGEAVKTLQQALICYGTLTGRADGSYGPATEIAVRKLQEAEGLEADGVAWPQTQGYAQHLFGEWEVVSELSDFSMGLRTRTCARCGYVETEEEWPSPMYRRGDRGDGVKALQTALNEAGYNCGKPDGDFGGNTEKAVKALEAAHGVEADGIAWPGVLKWLGLPEVSQTQDEFQPVYSLALQVVPDSDNKVFEQGEDLGFTLRVTSNGLASTMIDDIVIQAYDGQGAPREEYDIGTMKSQSGATVEDHYTFTAADAAAHDVTLRFKVTGTANGTPISDEKALSYTVIAKGDDESVAAEAPEAALGLVVSHLSKKPVYTLNADGTLDTLSFYGTVTNPGTQPVKVESVNLGVYPDSEGMGIPVYTFTKGFVLEPDHSVGFSATADLSQANISPAEPNALRLAFVALGHPVVDGEKQEGTVRSNVVRILQPIRVDGPSILAFAESTDDMTCAPGEGVTVMINVVNTGATELTGLTATGSSCGGNISPSGDSHYPLPSPYRNAFKPGEAFSFNYVVKCDSDDIAYNSAQLERAVNVRGTCVVTEKTVDDDANFTIRIVGTTDVGTPEPQVQPEPEPQNAPPVEASADDIAITKVVENLPSRGYFMEGETIQYLILVTNNTDHAINDVEVHDPLLGGEVDSRVDAIAVLEAHTSHETHLQYVVKASDVANGSVLNQAAAEWTDSRTRAPLTAWSGRVVTPTGRASEVVVTKTVENLPERGFFLEGETIVFAIHVENHTDHDLFNVDIYDPLCSLPGGILDTFPALAANIGGGTVYLNYTVTGLDVGYTIYNQAFAQFVDGNLPQNIPSNIAEAPTGAMVDGLIPPVTDQPGPTPSPTPAPAAICCVRTLVGVGEGEMDLTLDYCQAHAPIAEAVDALLAAAGTPEEQLAAWQSSIELWTEALNAEYDAQLSDADEADRPAIANERALFYLQLACHRDALEAQYPDDPAQVAMRLSEQLMNKTADLCYELHTAPRARVDSLTSETAAAIRAAQPGEDCARVIESTDTGAAYREILCGRHRAAEAGEKALLNAATTPDDRARAWQSACQLWLMELNAITNERYLNADEAARAAIAAERAAFGDWLTAREAQLDLLYPDQPEIVGEVLAQAVRARVLDLCAG